jgi:fatty-acyl-CoA synthase
MFLLEALKRHETRHRFKPFLVSCENGLTKQFSFGDALAQTRRWAHILDQAQVRQGDIVFIALQHRHEIYFCFLGAMWLGAVPAIIPFPTPKQDTALYWHEYKAMFAQVKPRALVTYRENIPALREALAGQACAVLDADDPELIGVVALHDPEPVAVAPGEPAFLQFSSGTTGLRKGVALSHAQVAQHMAAYSRVLGFDGKEVVASWLPLYHDMGLIACFLLPLHAGATIVSLDAFEWVAQPWRLLQAMDTYRATFAWLPNFALQHMVRTLPAEAAFDLRHVRAFINCSEVCKPETVRGFLDAMRVYGVRPEQLHTSYAMAEAVFAVTQSPLERAPRTIAVDASLLDRFSRARFVDPSYRNGRSFLSCGKVLDDLEVRIVPQAGSTADNVHTAVPGEIAVGEIQVRGGYLFSGYFRNDEATHAAMTEGWYRTGDIGFIEGGELFICGRLKEMLIVHGRNYYANDIEAIVGSVAGIRPGRSVAFGIDDPDSGSEEAIVLAETAATDTTVRAALQRDVKGAVFNRLDLTLKSVVLVGPGTLVKTTSGKLCRGTNKTRYLQPEPVEA